MQQDPPRFTEPGPNFLPKQTYLYFYGDGQGPQVRSHQLRQWRSTYSAFDRRCDPCVIYNFPEVGCRFDSPNRCASCELYGNQCTTLGDLSDRPRAPAYPDPNAGGSPAGAPPPNPSPFNPSAILATPSGPPPPGPPPFFPRGPLPSAPQTLNPIPVRPSFAGASRPARTDAPAWPALTQPATEQDGEPLTYCDNCKRRVRQGTCDANINAPPGVGCTQCRIDDVPCRWMTARGRPSHLTLAPRPDGMIVPLCCDQCVARGGIKSCSWLGKKTHSTQTAFKPCMRCRESRMNCTQGGVDAKDILRNGNTHLSLTRNLPPNQQRPATQWEMTSNPIAIFAPHDARRRSASPERDPAEDTAAPQLGATHGQPTFIDLDVSGDQTRRSTFRGPACDLCKKRCNAPGAGAQCDANVNAGIGCEWCSIWGLICVVDDQSLKIKKARTRAEGFGPCYNCKTKNRNCERKRPCDKCYVYGERCFTQEDDLSQCFFRGVPGDNMPVYYRKCGYGPLGVDDPPLSTRVYTPLNYHLTWRAEDLGRTRGVPPPAPPAGPNNDDSPILDTPSPGAGASPSASASPDPERRWAFESILDSRINGRNLEYLIKWVGYNDPTWQPAIDLEGCERWLMKFHDENDGKPGPPWWYSRDVALRQREREGSEDSTASSSIASPSRASPSRASPSNDSPSNAGQGSYIPQLDRFQDGLDAPVSELDSDSELLDPAAPTAAAIGRTPRTSIPTPAASVPPATMEECFNIQLNVLPEVQERDEIRLNNEVRDDQLLTATICNHLPELTDLGGIGAVTGYSELFRTAQTLVRDFHQILDLRGLRRRIRVDMLLRVRFADSLASRCIAAFLQSRSAMRNFAAISNIVFPDDAPVLSDEFIEEINPGRQQLQFISNEPVRRPPSPGPRIAAFSLTASDVEDPNVQDNSMEFPGGHAARVHTYLLERPVPRDQNPTNVPMLATIPYNRLYVDGRLPPNQASGCMNIKNGVPCGAFASACCEDTIHCPEFLLCDACNNESRDRLRPYLENHIHELRGYFCAICTYAARSPDYWRGIGLRVWGCPEATPGPSSRPPFLDRGGYMGLPLPMSGCACASKLLDRFLCAPHRLQHFVSLLAQIQRMLNWIHRVWGRRICPSCRVRPPVSAFNFQGEEGGELLGPTWQCIACHDVVVKPYEAPPEPEGMDMDVNSMEVDWRTPPPHFDLEHMGGLEYESPQAPSPTGFIDPAILFGDSPK